MATTGRRMAAIALVLCLVACGSPGVRAQSPEAAPGPAGGNDCFTALTNMSGCLTYVEEGSKQKKPEKACCGELAGLVDSNPICLCQLLAKPDFAGVKLDLNKALHLPSVCGVSTPPVSTCSAVGVPVSLSPSSSNVNPPSPSPMGVAPGPAGGGDCFTALTNMSDCLTFVEEGSKQKKPGKACCGEFAGLVDKNPICLCQLLAKPDFAGVKLDLNKALHLPSLCGVSTPPVSTCSAVGVPVSLPPSGSVNSPSLTPGSQLTPTSPSDLSSSPLSPGGSLTSPPAGNGGTSLNPSGLFFIFGLATIFL